LNYPVNHCNLLCGCGWVKLSFLIPLKAVKPEAKFLDEIRTKVLRVFLLVIHSHLYSFALRFLFLQIHATSYSFCKRERRKTDRKPYPLPYGLRNPYRNLKSENSQDYAQKPCTFMFMNSASGLKDFYQLLIQYVCKFKDYHSVCPPRRN
jgi:hypothetical protein